jgi:hypothetical protein
MSQLPHTAQRHPWHQACYALGELVEEQRRTKPRQQKQLHGEATQESFITFTMWRLVLLALYSVTYTVFAGFFLRPFMAGAMVCLVAQWLYRAIPTAVTTAFTETMDVVAALINQEHTLRQLAAPLVEAPLKEKQHQHECDSACGDGGEEAAPSPVEKPAKPDPVAYAIEAQWHQLSGQLERNQGRQHIALPATLLSDHEPLFVANGDRLAEHGYACVVGHCYGNDCLVLQTSERKNQCPKGCQCAQGAPLTLVDSFCTLF